MSPFEIAARLRATRHALIEIDVLGVAEGQRFADVIEDVASHNRERPQHDVLNAIRDLVGAAEESNLAETLIQDAREAHAAACANWGFPLTEQPHEPLTAPMQLAHHLATLVELDMAVRDDFASVERKFDGKGAALRITLASGQVFIAVVVQEG